MAFVLGIDEAGYGPLLGPLVVAATYWRAAPAAIGQDWWQCLGPCVGRQHQRRSLRLPVGDSKAIFDRKRGLATLERSVLAFARVAGVYRATAAELLAALGYTAGSHLPWYANLDRALPVDPARSAFEGAALRLRTAMNAAGIFCQNLRVELVTEDAFNQRVAQTRNKAEIVLEAVLRLVHWAGQQSGDQDLHVCADRLGGRMDYRAALMAAFPGRHVHVLEVNDACSRYRLATSDNDWHVEFRVGGERAHLPVALASMVAKYVRELLMERFNAYWHRLAPAVHATAGYYQDAERFLAEIRALVEQGTLPLDRFVRAC